ncbi:MAG: FAD-dependent monooxygenase [Actinomycetia bacterium]|nr:FAD-dependent monooxygenase [Actinomycetes bacterium]
MQYHYEGYISGDPRVSPAKGTGVGRPEEIPDTMDVLIVGTGPAGAITAAQLSQFPSVTTRVIERRGGRLELGRADGVSVRSVESFKAFGFAGRIMDEAYRITETGFWSPDPANPANIVRSSRTPDDPTGLSEFWHITVSQARVADYLFEYAANAPARIRPDYGWELTSVTVEDSGEYPVVAHLRRSSYPSEGREKVVRAKYMLGADGAHSLVRAQIGRKMEGTSSMHAWGVIDALVVTDFPDLRRKAIIQSEAGSILWIPREGGHLTRIYVDLGVLTEENARTIRATSLDTVVAHGNEILHPYSMKLVDVPWHSIYEVGHRVTDKFDNVPAEATGKVIPRVFIAGDACHTHSAKAGQGMNVSMQDGWNLGWKLGWVLDGRSPASLLDTYSAERQPIAQDLIDFDRKWSDIMAKKPEELTDPNEREAFYVGTWEFPSGMATKYPPALLVGTLDHQDLATGFPIGKRFKSAAVMRVCDSNPLQLGHLHLADGRWRIYVFADPAAAGGPSPTTDFATWWTTSPDSPLAAMPAGLDADDWFDLLVIYQTPLEEIEVPDLPGAFRPVMGPFKVEDWEKAFTIDPADDIFEARGISRDGAIVVVRPDEYVAGIWPLTAHAELGAFFKPILSVN